MRVHHLIPSLLVTLTAAACASDDRDAGGGLPPGAMGQIVADKLADVAGGAGAEVGLEYQIFDLEEVTLDAEVTPESCDAVDQRLAEVCGELASADQVGWCDYQTVFLYAHAVPRCAVRFALPSASGGLPTLYAMDFTGTPLTEPEPSCGDGVVDADEGCDDGNREGWDGCDPNCELEPFDGCEAVIEEIYRERGVATVRADAWKGPRSHLMTNGGTALRPIDGTACDQAIALADDVCHVLTEQMPFVGWCEPRGELHDGACSIRLRVGFDQRAPDSGVFSTALEGLLAFTIR